MKENYAVFDKYKNYKNIFEVRFDLLTDIEPIEKVGEYTNKQVIFTIRTPQDGGGKTMDKAVFTQKYKEAVDAGYSYIDVHVPFEDDVYASSAELDDICEYARDRGVSVIRSVHFMNSQPENLEQIYDQVSDALGDIVKLAVLPEGCHDILSLIKLADAKADSKKVILGMGDYGFPTRILSRRMGSLWTYCSPQQAQIAAPGHVSPEILEDVYGYSNIKIDAEIFCVIGNPIMHSKSPHIHNRKLKEHGLNAVYVPITVDVIDQFFKLADYLNIKGVSVTVPYKEAVVDYCASISEEVEFTGACNTLVRAKEAWKGYNTDIQGFLVPFKKFLHNLPLEGTRILIIGAGGAAKGIAYGLAKEGAALLIVNRTFDRAKKLADSIGCSALPLDDSSFSAFTEYGDAFVQTTNCGMLHFENIDPLEGYEFSGKEALFDIVYNPPVTKIMHRAQKAGCRTINGDQMLLEQAKVQYFLFTGKNYET